MTKKRSSKAKAQAPAGVENLTGAPVAPTPPPALEEPVAEPLAAHDSVHPSVQDQDTDAQAEVESAPARPRGAQGSLLERLAERGGSYWAVEVHLGIMLAFALFPLLLEGYKRLANNEALQWLNWTGVALGALAIVVGILLVELLVQALGLLNIMDVAGRELALYYVSPIAYVLGAAFLFMMGFVFWLDFQQFVQGGAFGGTPPSLRDVFGFMGTVLLFILPLWTMRLLAEEQRQGTIELLLTSPVRDFEVVVGKYIAAVSLFLDTLVLTVPYAIILFSLGNPDPGPMVAGYLGVFLFGAALLAVGVFTSSVTENQVIAAVLSFAIYLSLILLNAVSSFTGTLQLPDFVQKALGALNIFEHLDKFTQGIVDSYGLVFFLSLIALWVFLASRAIEMRRWR